MKYLSLFSGIEAASLAWEPLGWEPMAFCEIEPFPSAVLAHHWPHVPNLGDVTAVDWEAWLKENGTPDVIVAGAPCQAFSVAGTRRSLEDARGNLTLFTAELVRLIRPKFFLFENVPGLLSSRDNAFGCFLGELVGAGEALKPTGKRWTDAGLVSGPEASGCWRVFDAQYFAVAQRRARLFLVVCPREGADPAQVLLEQACLFGHPAPQRKTRSQAAGTLGGSSQSGGFRTTDLDNTGAFVANGEPYPLGGAEAGHLVPDQPQRQRIRSTEGVSETLSPGIRGPYTDYYATEDEIPDTTVMACSHYNAEIATDLCTRLSARQYKDPPICFKVRGGSPVNTGEQGGKPGGTAGKGYLGQEDCAFTVASSQDQWLAEPQAAVAFKPSHYTRGKDGAPSEVVPPLACEDDRGDQEPVVLAPVEGDAYKCPDCAHFEQHQTEPVACPACGSSGYENVMIRPTMGPHAGEQFDFGVQVYRKSQRAHSADDGETWADDDVANTLNAYENHNATRTTHAVVEPRIFTGDGETADPIGANEARTYTNEGAHNFRLHNCVADEPLALASRTRGGEKNIEWQEGVSYTLMNPGEGGRADERMVLAPDGPVAGFKTGQSVRGTFAYSEEQAPTLEGGGGGNNKPAVHAAMAVRRLTPRECERLQGMPDDHTRIPWRGKAAEDCPDGPRYKAIGNSMAVPVIRWIGRRMEAAE